ncbi:hypothetical protein [Helicobacter brantae]|uniref:DUF945 domain-containing protein n=1 Tax=Helicobacter brantae TaxID=375927 RepID=A0A3D8J0R0_9HELI|nr:hypothetical protein [Helicobacter brantae]RDU70755.1 hypothetical protein CQA58_04315 [Helicobacter brantae]
MNRRVIVALLCVGLSIILALGGVGLYKIHTLKLQAQELLNSRLTALALKSKSEGVQVSFQPFECSGLVFVECKSKEVAFTSSLLSQKNLSFQNIVLKADEFDFKSLAFVLDSDVLPPKIEEIEEYIQALFPHHINLRLKLSAEDKERYKVDTRLLLEAENVNYQEEFESFIVSDELKTKGFFASISNLDFLSEKMEVKNIIFTFTSKDLSQAVYEIVKSKYGGLGKKEYLGLANIMIGASMMQFEGNKEIQEIIAGAGALVLGEADEMRIYIRAKGEESIIVPQEIIEMGGNGILDVLVEKYDFETKVEKKAK